MSTEHRRMQADMTCLLVFKLLHTLVDFGKQGIHIQKIWAKSSTVAGIKLCRDFGFTELDYINNEQIGFVLDLETSGLPIAHKYRDALAASMPVSEAIMDLNSKMD